MPGCSWSTVKAVCFDLDGTLYRAPSLRIRMLGLLLRGFLRGEVSARELRILRCYRKSRERARQLGPRPNLEDYTLGLTARECKCDAQEVARVVQRWLFQTPLAVLARIRDPGLLQLFRRLRLRGYRLGVLSDYPVKSKLEALELPMTLFDAIVEAGEPGVDALKPHPHGFLQLCRRLSLQPEEILYIGNRDSVDGCGARSVGMHFLLYNPFAMVEKNKEVIRDLSRLEKLLAVC